ncbi:hypothetical protein E4U22_007771 [Claviceps purpurea]|nr:hypothetical protein E4U22_007771 [Claviceps purpurea]
MDSGPSRSAGGQNTSAGKANPATETPEQLLDVFKAAALSVTKLYKTSAVIESRARTEGFKDCLDDLLTYLDKENLGLKDGEALAIRKWATERLEGRDINNQPITESEDEIERISSSPEVTRTSVEPQPVAAKRAESFKSLSESPKSSIVSIPEEPMSIVVPSQDTFTFQSSHPYPNIATLDLSDSRSRDVQSLSSTRSSKSRLHNSRSSPRGVGHLGKGAGTKRRWDFDDFFGGCLGGKEQFGNGKRSRHS